MENDVEGKVQNYVELIDTQHQELFKRASDFLQSVQEKGDWEENSAVRETLGLCRTMWLNILMTKKSISVRLIIPGMRNTMRFTPGSEP